jgi:ribose transport system substrate-binding protein
VLVAAAAAAATLVVSACGSGGGSGSGEAGSGGTAADVSFDARTTLDQAFAGITFPQPTQGPAAQSGKNVWYLSCLSYPTCRNQVSAFEDAAKTLGWQVNALDNKVDPNTAINQIRQAISAKADAIVLNALDCSKIKTGLDAARAANIPVLGVSAADCDDPLLGSAAGPEPGFAAVQKLDGTNSVLEYFQLLGRSNAEVTVAAAMQDGITSPRIMRLAMTDVLYQKMKAEAFDKRVAEICPNCTITPVDLTLSQMAQQGQQIFRNAFLQNPTADVVYFPFDAALPAGLQPALAGAANVKVACCGDGQSGSIDFARSAAAHVIVNVSPNTFFGYAQADIINRLLAGQKRADLPNEGGYVQYLDKTHNMPAPGTAGPPPPYDFVAGYQSVWRNG